MKRFRKFFGALVIAALIAPAALADTVEERFAEKITDAEVVVEAALNRKGNSIPIALIKEARAIAVFPKTFKAGLVFGARYGEGILMAQGDDKTWSAPAYYTLTAASAGLQAGLQEADIVLLIMNDRGLRAFLKQEVTLGADFTVAAGPGSLNATGDKDIGMQADIYSYTRSRGLFAGVSVNGARISNSNRFNTRYYGNQYSVDDIVIRRQVNPPVVAKSLISKLDAISNDGRTPARVYSEVGASARTTSTMPTTRRSAPQPATQKTTYHGTKMKHSTSHGGNSSYF